PQAFVRKLQDDWGREGHELIQGDAGWLPDQDWARLNRRVYRVETAIKKAEAGARARAAARFYLDAHLILFSPGERFSVRAMTPGDDHVAFRAQAEGLIRSLELGPSPGRAEALGQPAPTRPAATPPSTGRPTTPAPSDRPAPSRSDLPAPPPVPR